MNKNRILSSSGNRKTAVDPELSFAHGKVFRKGYNLNLRDQEGMDRKQSKEKGKLFHVAIVMTAI